MTQWNDTRAWAALVDGSACPICDRGQPLDVIAVLETSWLTMQERAPVRGYACLVLKTHVVELHELDEPAALAFMRDIRRVSSALCKITGAVKLNYEIHGNTLPHLHMHFFPRYRGDAFEGRPIDARAVVQPPYKPGEFSTLRRELLDVLTDNAA